MKNRDGFVALASCKDRTAVMATRIPGSKVKVSALAEMYSTVESSPFRKMVLDFGILVEGGTAFIYAVVDQTSKTRKWIKQRLHEFVAYLRDAGVLHKPIISYLKVPVRDYKFV